jgi:hypothetical protein
MDNLNRLLLGAKSGIERMQSHIDDESYDPEKVFLAVLQFTYSIRANR